MSSTTPAALAALVAEFKAQLATKSDYTEDDLLAEFYGKKENNEKDSNDAPQDPLKAKFFDEFMKDPAKETAKLDAMREEAMQRLGEEEYFRRMWQDEHSALKKKRLHDFRLNQEELEKYKENGFVVSERLGVESFAEAYYRTYTDDLPVFVSADSILHAWHMSFSSLLQEVEEACLLPTLMETLTGMHEALQNMADRLAQRPDGLDEVDYYLATAISLLNGKACKPKFSDISKVTQTLHDIENLSTSCVEMFGEQRDVDFSQFKPRGHYADSDALSNYFRAMMWLGRIDFRLCAGSDSSTTQLKACMILVHLLYASGQANEFLKFNRVLVNFVGETDSLDAVSFSRIVGDTFGDTSSLMSPTNEQLNRLETVLAGQNVGVEQIQSHIYYEGKHPPRSFAFIGQKFTLDAFVFSHATFDRIFWKGEKVQRRRPCGMDIAFSVLGNDVAAVEINHSIKSTDSPSWKDGKPYAHQISALRSAIDKLPDSYWHSSVYTMWLNALRALSRVPSERECKMFHSEAWRKRVLNAQLGSWSELKHDTVLYAKQAYGCMTCCEYAAGLVEPVPEFFRRMGVMCQTMKALLEETDLYSPPSDGGDSETRRRWWNPKQKHARFLDLFTNTMKTLEDICLRQQNKEPLTEELNNFLGSVMNVRYGSGGTRYNGWYPKLFYAELEQSGKFKPCIADVFTAPKDPLTGDTGGVLHVGIGNVFMAILAADGVAYAGPVFSYYEFEESVDKRLDDGQWETMIREGKEMPALPGWATKSFAVTKPGSCTN